MSSAGGAVPTGILVEVVARRTGLGAMPTSVELEDAYPEGEVEDATVRDEAVVLLARLDDHEQLLLFQYEKNFRDCSTVSCPRRPALPGWS